MPSTAHDFLKDKLPYGEIDLVRTEKDFLQRVLSGVPVLIVDGFTEFLAMDFPMTPIPMNAIVFIDFPPPVYCKCPGLEIAQTPSGLTCLFKSAAYFL